MRRISVILAALLLCLSMVTSASAATGASSVTGFATVAADGSCQVSLTVVLHLDQAMDKLSFPVPKDASGVKLNGSRVSASRKNEARQVSLNRLVRNVVGDLTFNIQYHLRDVIYATENDTLEMRLPLLDGFDYPVQYLEFSVTMPGPVENRPAFVSGYHQTGIEEHLLYTISGAMITGKSLQAMKDHETLTMTMTVSEQMFPQTIVQTGDYSWSELAMVLCGALALVYWIITLWNRPGLARLQTDAPQGYHAGALGSILTRSGLDLTMMVLSWAQLGYILIQFKGKKVILHKRMEMGNERSDTEQRYFRKLFAKRDRVDTSDARYAQLCCIAAKKPEGVGELFRRFNGNPVVFRVLTTGVGLFGGVSIAVALLDGAALQGLMMFLLGVLGAVSGWYMPAIGTGIFLHNKTSTQTFLILGSIWIILGVIADMLQLALIMVGGLLLAGILLAWGGRRTPLGRQAQMQTVGFARYLRTADTALLRRQCAADPDYFFRLAPAALALGMEKTFAKRFGKDLRLERCPYLTTGMDGHMTPLQWAGLMRRAVDSMNARAKGLLLERTIRLIRNMIRT